MSELPVYDGVTQPDFAGPHQFLSRTPDLDIRVASLGGQSITADRLTFSTLAAVESSDVLLVPGDGCIAEVPSMRDGRVFLTLIRKMPSVPGNRTNQACLSHPWSEM